MDMAWTWRPRIQQMAVWHPKRNDNKHDVKWTS